MALFGMQNNSFDGRDSSNTSIYQRVDRFNVDLTNPVDSRFTSQRSSSLPAEFGDPLELYDSSQHPHQECAGASAYSQLQMRMVIAMLDRLIKALEMLLLAQLANPFNDGCDRGGKTGGIKPPRDNGGKSPTNDGGSKSGDDKPPVNGGNDKPPENGGNDKPPMNGDNDKPPVNGGNDKPPVKGGDDKPPVKSGGDKPPVDDGNTRPPDVEPGDGSVPKYAATGVRRGRTIYRDDFSGARNERPNGNIFDTDHISPDGLTRQRGEHIRENAIIDDDNSVMDGKGYLQIFAKKQRTLDPKTGEYVDYTKGSYNTGKSDTTNNQGLTFNLQDHENGLVIEVRAKHPENRGAKFNPLWFMTDTWAADPEKGQKMKDTLEFDAAEGGGAGITVHYPVKENGKSKDHYGGGKKLNLEDGKFHTYTVVISHNGDVVEYVDGEKVFEKEKVFPTDKPIHLRASLEVSPEWIHRDYEGEGGMDSDGAGYIDYLDVSQGVA